MVTSSPAASPQKGRLGKRRRRLEVIFLCAIVSFSLVSLTLGPSLWSATTTTWFSLPNNPVGNNNIPSSFTSAKEQLLQGYLEISNTSKRRIKKVKKKKQIVRHHMPDIMDIPSINATRGKQRIRKGQFLDPNGLDRMEDVLLGQKKDDDLDSRTNTTNTKPSIIISQFRKSYSYQNVPCRYHGHCPVGTICGETGVCVTYLPSADVASTPQQYASMDTHLQTTDSSLYNCAVACHHELALDEWYQDESNITIHNIQHARNPHQCLLTYTRFPGRWPNVPSVEEWMQRRFRHVVRVDPQELLLPNTTGNRIPEISSKGDDLNNRWYALCNRPCTHDDDCPNATCQGRLESDIPPGISATPKTCQTKPMSTEEDLVLVTGAGNSYFGGLQNLVASALYWAPNTTIVVYNLGMTPEQLDKIRNEWAHPNLVLEWPNGIPEHYPDHVQNRLTNYAWKPIIVNETVHKYKAILWHDAGSTFVGPLDPIRDILHRQGTFLVHGQDADMSPKAFPDMFRCFGQNKSTMPTGPHFGGSAQGFVWPSRYIDTIVIPNAECAMAQECIAPEGSRLSNHRYDQTSLSILAYHKHVHCAHYTEFLAAHPDQVHMSNKDGPKPTRFVLYTSRQSNWFYSQHYEWNGDTNNKVQQQH